ncbi:MAG: hypothetical protein WCH74_01145, partial [Chloroflexota bacterium]
MGVQRASVRAVDRADDLDPSRRLLAPFGLGHSRSGLRLDVDRLGAARVADGSTGGVAHNGSMSELPSL